MADLNRQSDTPIYVQLANRIRAEIQAGQYGEGERLPSAREFADRYGVNHLTVRNAVRILTEEGAVRASPGRGTFVASTKRQLQVALILPNLGQEQCGAISEGVRHGLEGRPAVLHVLDYNDREARERELLGQVRDRGYDGAIIYPSLHPRSVQALLSLMVDGFPIVLVDRVFGGVPSWSVLSDNFKGGRLAAGHLLDQGCRRPACVMAASLPTVEERLAGFREGLAERDVLLPAKYVARLTDEGDLRARTTAELLALKPRPDGLFYFNDYQALAGIREIRSLGFSVPDDVCVVGFDDLTAANLSQPPLTTIRQDTTTVGRKASEAVLAQLALSSGERFIDRRELVPVELIVRESTKRGGRRRPGGRRS